MSRCSRWVVLLSGLLLLVGCGGGRPPVVLIGLDGLDWHILTPMIEAGELPNFARFVKEGSTGILRSEEPLLSPIIWSTIATGLPPDRHRVLDFTAPDPEGGDPMVVTSLHRRAKAFWNLLSEQGVSVGVIGWWATWPAEPLEHGFVVSDRVGYHAFIGEHRPRAALVHPPSLTDRVLGSLRSPSDVTFDEARRFMNVTPDEFAAKDALDFTDPIGHFRHIYVTMENMTRLAETLYRERRPAVLAVYLEGIDSAGHTYGRFAPPDHPSTTAGERERFGDTFAEFYRYQDSLLGRLVAAVGEDATYVIVSDHGFLTGSDRPARVDPARITIEAVRWHRIEGALLALGPNVTRGATISDATIRDVCPTVLALAGLPASREMEGKVIAQITPPELQPGPRVRSYEDAAWLKSRQADLAGGAFDGDVMERLAALGYIDEGDGEDAHNARSWVNLGSYYRNREELARAERCFRRALEIDPENLQAHSNLGRLLYRAARHDEAVPHLSLVWERDPTHASVGQSLCISFTMTGRAADAVPIAESLSEAYPDIRAFRVNLAIAYRMAGRPDAALGILEAVVAGHPGDATAWDNLGDTYVELDRSSDAESAYRHALRIDPGDTYAITKLEALATRDE